MAKKILVLGAGMVSGPCIDYLLRKQYDISVVSAIQTDLERVSCLFPSAKTIHLNVEQETPRLHDIVSLHDVIISLLPAHLHPQVIQCCIDCKKSLVHASYENEHIRAVDESANAAGITILSEVGLDPGIDHMLAMSCIDSVKAQGAQVSSYISMCGGLPAPECSYGPLRYKFSWYPKGMFMSAMKKSSFIRNGQVVDIPEGHIFNKPEIVDDLVDGCELENIPNRDSTEYIKAYNIQSASTIHKGTLRYKGFSHRIKALISLGLTNSDIVSQLLPDSSKITWRQLICLLNGISEEFSQDEIKDWMQNKIGLTQDQLATIDELGLIRDEEVSKLGSPLDVLSAHLARKLAFDPQERDMVVMKTIIESILPNGKRQQHTFNLVQLGQVNGHSAMAQTVGLTVAISASLLVEGVITTKGAIMPLTKDIYEPVLKMLTLEGIQIKSTITFLD